MFRFALVICGLFLLMISIYFIPWFSIKTDSQASNLQPGNTTLVMDESKINVFGSKVYGSVFPLNYNGENLREFTLSQPLPKIWLVTAENENPNSPTERKIEISEDAQEILHRHWIKALKFRYVREVEEFSKDINYQKEDIEISNSTIRTENLLLELPIDNENESRNFSAYEANQVIILIRDKADELINEIKQLRQSNGGA